MMKSFIAVSTATFLAGAYVNAETAPYAGQEQRAIATLSEEDVAALLDGRGWGFALAAELNGYPGPLHVLELADEIGLTASQRTEVQAIFDEMNEQARRLGSDYVAAEAELSQAFDLGTINGPELQALVAASARIEADLRSVHLAAHLATKPLMSRHQIMLYNKARGYDEHNTHHGHQHD